MSELAVIACVAAALGIFYLFLVFPKRPSQEALRRFSKRSYAHRGLYDNENGVPENSLAAFEAAMQRGYGCELDVQFTKDRKIIVFHDNDFLRACGVNVPVWQLTYDEIRALRLFDTRERVPLLSDVLRVVSGRQPLIVELKAEGIGTAWYYDLCAAVLSELRTYSGDFCIESFHPLVVRWFRKNAPDVLRGQLLMASGHYSGTLSPVAAFLLSRMLTNCVTRPHFAAHREDDSLRRLHWIRRLGAMSVLWTVRSQQRHDALIQTDDAIIFEHYTPAARF